MSAGHTVCWKQLSRTCNRNGFALWRLCNDDYAWYQSFHDGFQNYSDTDYKLRARAVRRIPIE